MGQENYQPMPFGLPDQVNGLATSPVDRGDETQERFRYQWAIGVCLLAQGLTGSRAIKALWCEHHEDFLIELSSGRFIAVQVKTDGGENARWRWSDTALVDSITRFCVLEKSHGNSIDNYEFFSNAEPYVPGASSGKDTTVASSPMRLVDCCKATCNPEHIAEPYSSALNGLAKKTGHELLVVFRVLKKLRFALGPVLRGYEDTLSAKVIPEIPGCASLLLVACCRLRDELISLVQNACRLNSPGVDGAISYLANNGRAEFALRGKCITLESASELISRAGNSHFRFIDSGTGLKLGTTPGRTEVLQRKMLNAYIGSQFESLRLRMDSADQRLLERAYLEPEQFEAIAQQLQGAVLVECKDAEAAMFDHADEKTRGMAIYRMVLQRMAHLAENEPGRVCSEPKDTLMGVAGMLSGECKFAWGTPLEEKRDGS